MPPPSNYIKVLASFEPTQFNEAQSLEAKSFSAILREALKEWIDKRKGKQ